MTYPLEGEDPKWGSWTSNPMRQAYRTYLAFLQGAFADLKDSHYERFLWSPDPQETKINITTVTPMDAEQVEQHPAVVVTPQGTEGSGSAIGDVDDIDPLRGTITYIDQLSGLLSCYAISKSKPEAEDLGWVVRELTWTLRRALIANGKFYTIGNNIKVGPALPPGSLVSGGDARGPIYAVPLAIPFSVCWRSTVQRVNVPKLETIMVGLTAEGKTLNPARPPLPTSWTIEKWIEVVNKKAREELPSDPGNVQAPLPTEPSTEGQSSSEVLVRVDLID